MGDVEFQAKICYLLRVFELSNNMYGHLLNDIRDINKARLTQNSEIVMHGHKIESMTFLKRGAQKKLKEIMYRNFILYNE